jgi:hypothetical protein
MSRAKSIGTLVHNISGFRNLKSAHLFVTIMKEPSRYPCFVRFESDGHTGLSPVFTYQEDLQEALAEMKR